MLAMMLGGLNTRTVALSFLVAVLVTGGNLWIHRGDTPLGYMEYAKYGFTLLYPSNWYYYEGDFTAPGEGISDLQGLFQAESRDSLELIIVGWTISKDTPTGEDKLLKLVQPITDSAQVTFTKVGSMKYYDKEGTEVTYVVSELVQMELPITAVFGTMAQPWPSLRSNRVYLFIYAADTASTSEAQAEERFLRFIDGFHSPA